MASFDRLFKLAEKTGDRLIVFDSHTGNGFAAIPIDEYEDMVSNPRDVTALSGDQLIEQINHDIGKWRESQEEEEDFLDMFGSEEDEDIDGDDDWQSAGDILGSKYMRPEFDTEAEDEDNDDDLFGDVSSMPFGMKEKNTERNGLAFDFQEKREQGPFFHAEEEEELEQEPKIELLPRPIPPMEKPAEGVWEEEPLDEDPIFFEEPV